MGTMSIGGLSTGLDTKNIISQLMELDSKPKTMLQWKQQLTTSRESAWKDLNTRLAALKTSANLLITPATWDQNSFTPTGAFAAASSTSGVASASVAGTPASTASYSLDVYQLARGQRSTSGGFGTIGANDTLHITRGATTIDVAVTAGDTATDVMAKINAASGSPVVAGMTSGSLWLQSKTTGAAEAFTVTSDGAAAATLNLSTSVSAEDSLFAVDGVVTSSASNSNTTAITGVKINLTGIGNSTIDVTQGGDSAQEAWIKDVKSKVKDFVDKYNSSLEYVYTRTSESKVASPKNLGEYLQGPMARDTSFNSVAFQLRDQAGSVVSGLSAGSNMLVDIGLKTSYTVGAGTAAGKITIDDAALDSALRTDPARVQSLLGQVSGSSTTAPDADDGIARKVSDMVATMLATDNTFDLAAKRYGAELKTLQTSIDAMTRRLDKRQEYYEKMYASLEVAIGKLQSQGNELSSRIASMTNSK